jgi:hypothetical protein
MKFPRISIRLRLTLCCLAISLIAGLLFGAGMWAILRENLFDLADDSLSSQAASLERFIIAHKDASLAQLQADIAGQYRIERSADYLQISDSAGNSIYRSPFFEEHPLAPVSTPDLDTPFYLTRKLGNERFRLLTEQMDVEGRMFTVRIGHPMRDESEILDDFRRYLLWVAPLLLLSIAAVTYWLTGQILRLSIH